ncbi:hypothetical protein OSB04_014677 [Centaurea solstitialis]|uniref:TIR domain-containing protein n=1 Tax=Centaurea solstitialis TaxID=347529 RepID=A0AA38TFU1_9ASTR|nr:hypothetical protein OSB04_014677 [Centaurea solstitialis]
MASSSSPFDSTPSSSTSQSWTHDVFLSFRGTDTRNTFVDHLYSALDQRGIHTYKDDVTLPRGETIGPSLLKAIEESQIAVIAFSENYADSSWCLQELAHIMKCKDERGLTVIPFSTTSIPLNSENKRGNTEKHLPNIKGNGIGQRCSDGWNMGSGGAGKTTLASALYDEISSKFEVCCFVENIREKSSISDGLQKLQEKILKVVLNKEEINRVEDGKCLIKDRFCRKKVLIVLDDVDHLDQLEALAGSHDWFGEGSRIVITTRDMHLLTAHKVNVIYNISLLYPVEAMKLFRKHAPQHDRPVEDYEKLSKEVVSYAGGLPLALKVLGSFLCDKDISEWRSALARLKEIPESGILEKLKISYDGLKSVEKELFLDIACFFRGYPKDFVREILDACGFYPDIGVKVLIEKALITVSKEGVFDMHDLVQEMGHHIVRGENPKNLELHSRVWQLEDVVKMCSVDAMKENDKIRALRVQFQWLGEIDYLPLVECPLNLPQLVGNMKKLRWISVDGFLKTSLPSEFQPTNLCYLKLMHYPTEQLWEGNKVLPNLKVINLSYSFHLVKTPDFSGLPCLERLILRECNSLKEIHSSIGYHQRLIFLDMKYCTSLEIFPPIIRMKKLETLILHGCNALRKFPEIQTSMDNLKELRLGGSGIEVLPSSIGEYCTSLRSLDLGYCKRLQSIEGNFHHLKHLKSLYLNDCDQLKNILTKGLFDIECCLQQLSSFKNLHRGMVNLKLFGFSSSLRKLSLGGCNLVDGDIFSVFCKELANLQALDLSRNNFSRLHSNLLQLPRLKYLNLSSCKSLIEFPDLPSSISILIAEGCDSLDVTGNFPTSLKWLWNVSLSAKICNFGSKFSGFLIYVDCGVTNMTAVVTIKDVIDWENKSDMLEVPNEDDEIELVPKRSQGDDSIIEKSSEFWDDESPNGKTFEIIHDSESHMKIEWDSSSCCPNVFGKNGRGTKGGWPKTDPWVCFFKFFFWVFFYLSINTASHAIYDNSNKEYIDIFDCVIVIRQVLPNLKVINLSYSFHLVKTPDFSGLPCLERLILRECNSLKEIHSSIGYHQRLIFLDMKYCTSLEIFPPIIRMKKLETLILHGCNALRKFPEIQTSMDNLKELRLGGSGIEVLPSSIGEYCTSLRSLDLGYCKRLQSIEGNFHHLKHLKSLYLNDCDQLKNILTKGLFDIECCLQQLSSFKNLHRGMVNLKLFGFSSSLRKLSLGGCNLVDGDIFSVFCKELANLQALDLSRNNFSRLHSNLLQLPRLKYLNLSSCKSLIELPDLPLSISILIAEGCDSLDVTGNFPTSLKWLWNVSLSAKICNFEQVLQLMLQGNAVEDYYFSIRFDGPYIPIRGFADQIFTLQLPWNWNSKFSGFLIYVDCGVTNMTAVVTIKDVIDRENKSDMLEVPNEDDESKKMSGMYYISFGSLKETSWWNSTHTTVSFSLDYIHSYPKKKVCLKVELVPKRSQGDDSIIEKSSEFWDDESPNGKTFEIIHDSESHMKIEWDSSRYEKVFSRV